MDPSNYSLLLSYGLAAIAGVTFIVSHVVALRYITSGLGSNMEKLSLAVDRLTEKVQLLVTDKAIQDFRLDALEKRPHE